MKKAPWFRLAQSRSSETLDQPADELEQYKRRRSVVRRTRQRAEEECRYQARLKEWLGLPQNRWCRVYLLLLGRCVRATQCNDCHAAWLPLSSSAMVVVRNISLPCQFLP